MIGVAPRAAEVAAGEADEEAGPAGPGRLALDAEEELVDQDLAGGEAPEGLRQEGVGGLPRSLMRSIHEPIK